ncbi:MAG: hypothetical protein A2Y53_08010 [Chloroflexi bacterium RBG_16_47_49]|nr:MAG: hypothetical protein A2Y53_08010 [Chloroflexi bacterium RBG_16_47_49]
MKIVEFDPHNSYRIQQFIDLPTRIYRNIEQWVPPLVTEVKIPFDQRKNPFYKHSTATFFLAVTEDGSPIGRLAVLNNRNYNNFNHTQTAFFCLFESFPDQQIARKLFEAGFQWARNQGLESIIGPRGFTALGGLGLLVKGFEYRPAFGVTYNPPYYPELIEATGFQKENDIVSGYLSATKTFPDKIHKISELVQQRRGLKIINFRDKRELRKMVPKIMNMYNEMVQGTSGNVPLTKDEVSTIANQLIWFANPRLIKIIEKDDIPVGFLFAYPDISAALQRINGKLYPLGWIQLLLEMRRTEWVNINGAGIIEQYQGLGGTAILFSEMYKSVIDGGFKHAELVQIGVDNDNMQRELRKMGIDFYKVHRIYQRAL